MNEKLCSCGDCENQEHLLDVMGGRPTMTNQERAEKIADHLEDHLPLDPTAWKGYLKPYLLAQLDEAMRDTVVGKDLYFLGFSDGYAAAREQAARIAENSIGVKSAANFIRAMTPGGK